MDPMNFPLVEAKDVAVYTNSSMSPNDKPHLVACYKCEYKTTVQGIAAPICGQCGSNLITIVKSALPDELVKSAYLPTSGT